MANSLAEFPEFEVFEMAGSGDGQFSPTSAQSNSITRTFYVSWDNATRLREKLTGTYTQVGTVGQRRDDPMQHPNYNWLYCRSANVRGAGAITGGYGGVGQYQKAIVTAHYAPLDRSKEQAGDDVWMTETRSGAAEFLTYPKNSLKWGSGAYTGKKLNEKEQASESHGIVVHRMRITLTINNWINAPVSDGRFEDHQGDVNNATIRFLNATYKKWTLMFETFDFTRQFTSSGAEAWQVKLDFLHNRKTWQKMLDPDGKFSLVKQSDGSNLFEDYDFKKLVPGLK